MWRDDLALVGQILRLMLRRATCRCRHGWIVTDVDWVGVQCARCGSVSPGITVATAAIRRAWHYDSQRARFRKAS